MSIETRYLRYVVELVENELCMVAVRCLRRVRRLILARQEAEIGSRSEGSRSARCRRDRFRNLEFRNSDDSP